MSSTRAEREPSIMHLPPEIYLEIASYVKDPLDRLCLAYTCSSFLHSYRAWEPTLSTSVTTNAGDSPRESTTEFPSYRSGLGYWLQFNSRHSAIKEQASVNPSRCQCADCRSNTDIRRLPYPFKSYASNSALARGIPKELSLRLLGGDLTSQFKTFFLCSCCWCFRAKSELRIAWHRVICERCCFTIPKPVRYLCRHSVDRTGRPMRGKVNRVNW